MRARTVTSEQVWQSPDGQKTIWNVVLEGLEADAKGHQYPLKTFSSKIAEVGFEGDVESYANQRGDRFVKQAPKAVAGPYQGRDDSAIKAQWAIGQAIALTSATMDKKSINMKIIEDYAKQLFATVSRVKGETFTPQMGRDAERYIRNMSQPMGV
jgi:hypothetical protein